MRLIWNEMSRGIWYDSSKKTSRYGHSHGKYNIFLLPTQIWYAYQSAISGSPHSHEFFFGPTQIWYAYQSALSGQLPIFTRELILYNSGVILPKTSPFIFFIPINKEVLIVCLSSISFDSDVNIITSKVCLSPFQKKVVVSHSMVILQRLFEVQGSII